MDIARVRIVFVYKTSFSYRMFYLSAGLIHFKKCTFAPSQFFSYLCKTEQQANVQAKNIWNILKMTVNMPV